MDKTFKELWKELCKLGWKAKRPTGLGIDFRYVRQGITTTAGTEGLDYFTGVDALMTYARSQGWLRIGVPVLQATLGPADAGTSAVAGLHSAPADTAPADTSRAPTVPLSGSTVTTRQLCSQQPPTHAGPSGRSHVEDAVLQTAPSPRPPSNTAQDRHASAIPSTTAQAESGPAPLLITSDTAQAVPRTPSRTLNTALDDEGKENTVVLDSRADCDDEADFNTYDSNGFLAALSQRKWLGDPDEDDPNPCDSESEIDEADDVASERCMDEMLDEDIESQDDEIYDEVVDDEWLPRDDICSDSQFMNGDELDAVAANWTIYDEHHSHELQVEGASDLYDGRQGPTASARACSLIIFCLN
ncbi:hypothetical protein PHYBOEH_008972 [Phytophthora boehmeriae]|uniref:Uncharacterized protein n=1 Tax=Phytophthora boehmeriae TaxID=109152 RepID=A0A8T1W0D1_9STRA|nr:hypothetical protein PHYBOEH_008972 [Phytophthora boehmeriae]